MLSNSSMYIYMCINSMQDLNGYCLTPGKLLWVVTLSSFIHLSVMEDDTFYHHCTLGHEKCNLLTGMEITQFGEL